MTGRVKYNYGTAIRAAFEYLLENHPEVFVIGQGLWSPWYVGNTMTDLDKKFGKERIIDTPVSEAGTTGVAIGASIFGSRPIVVHPRIDFMLYAVDPIVNQAANKGSAQWRINLGQYSVELYLENNGIDKPYYVNSISDEINTTVFVVVNLDHPFYEGNDLETANLNLRHAVMDAISEYAAGRIDRSDHTLVNIMKDRFLRLEWKAEQNQPTEGN